VSGMVTAPPVPVYPVIVIVPLLVVKLNWACTTAGNADSNSSGSSTFRRIFITHSEFLEKGWSAVAVVGRKIGAAEKRFQVRGEEHVERPAAAPRRGLHEGHVDLVHVGPFLPVQFDADKMLPQKCADVFVLKTFALHDMAPVAGGVSDAQKYGFVLGTSATEGFGVPRKPIHGIMGVLEQIGRFFPGEGVGVFVRVHAL